MNVKSNIWKLYIHEALAGMFFSVPVMVVFWQSNGLSITQIMLLQSIFSLIVVALEIPTGYISDIFGRRQVIILSDIIATIGLTTYAFGHSFWVFLVGEVILGVSMALLSGSCSSIVYESLQASGEVDQYKRLWGNVLFVGLIALAVSGIVG